MRPELEIKIYKILRKVVNLASKFGHPKRAYLKDIFHEYEKYLLNKGVLNERLQ